MAVNENKKTSLSIVIPAYRSAEALPTLLDRLQAALTPWCDTFEIIIVDDGSPDATWDTLKALKTEHDELKIVRLARNCGQHNALLCGMGMAEGEIVVTMDDDLQNRPEDVKALVDAVKSGYDLAIASYETKQHSAGRNLGGNIVDSVQRKIFNLPSDFQLTSFRAVKHTVVEHAVSMGGVFPYITAMLLSHTSNYVNVPVTHDERAFGTSNYNMKRSLLLAFNLLLNYSAWPLYCVVGLCALALMFSMALGAWVSWQTVAHGATIQGWASTMTGIAFFNSLTLLAIVILGLYVSRISQQVTRSRVSFSIGEVVE